jgi:predicted nucleotidyltransferase
MLAPAYPTPQHAAAAEEITRFFSRTSVDALLLMGSCARGKADRSSCLDILVLCRPGDLPAARADLEPAWEAHYQSQPVFAEMRALAPFSHVDLDFIDGAFDPVRHNHGWTTGADEFELEVGNTLAYSVPLWEGGSYYQELRAHWLPYYGEELRNERLAMVTRYCRNNLAHITGFIPRKLYFQSFKRLYHAFEEFLQALFISRRVYPIAYDKWVHEGIVDILGLPELYARLPRLFEISRFESEEILDKARALDEIVDEYLS